MKRVSLFATTAVAAIVALGAFASMSMAAPGLHSSIRAATTKTTINVTENPTEFYGEVSCVVKRTVSKKFPGGRDNEKCTAVNGVLANMVAGKGQKEFKGINGNDEPFTVAGWDSDFDGKLASSFEYNVASNLKKFTLVAVYAPPEA